MKVSVLMTVYNDGGRLLEESISSIVEQTYSNIQLVIVDDGSTDNSKEIIKTYAEKDSRVKFISRKENKGRVYSLNEGLSVCDGDMIFINDADDISHLNRIEKCISFYKNNIKNKEKFGVLGTSYIMNYINKNIKYEYKIKFGTLSKKKIYLWRILIGMPFPHSSFMYNKKALEYIGGFPKEVTSSIDYFALIKIATKYNVFGLDEILVERTIDNKNYFMTESMTKNNELNKKKINRWIEDNIKFYYLIRIPSKLRKVIKR